MPRPTFSVKNKSKNARLGRARFVDIHLHGAFGFDPIAPSATSEGFGNYCAELFSRAALTGFCPTTLSQPWEHLRESVQRLGQMTRAAWEQSGFDPRGKSWKPKNGPWRDRAIPLGIHLEGPFLAPGACGAHPPDALRTFAFEDLEDLWKVSRQTLLLITLAPESFDGDPQTLSRLVEWAKDHRVRLSLGHTQATQTVAQTCFDAGFTGVTHAWNALAFHHREPGVLGAALGRKDTYVEVILDGVHVRPTVAQWMLKLHGADRLCGVSDCTPAAGTHPGSHHSFGSLWVTLSQDGASHLAPSGPLAGGGRLLHQALELFPPAWLPALTTGPLNALGIAPAVQKRLLSR